MEHLLPIVAGSTLVLTGLNAAPSPMEMAGAEEPTILSPAEVEQLIMRRFNPLTQLTAATLTSSLDAFDLGDLAPAARLWAKIAERERVLSNVKSKREEAIALRPIRVEPLNDSPEAKDQQAVIEAFLAGLKGGHALNRQITGGVALVVQQMMESVSYFYAAHHFRFAPDASKPIKLPSGAEVPTLGCTAEYVPLEYFEARTGELRFLGPDLSYNGQPLEPNRWMITTGPGLMRAASIAIFEARLARHDRLNLSEKWGQPAIIGHTTAGKNTDQGRAMKSAVTTVAANYRGVIYGAAENKIEPLWPSGSGGSGNSPMKEIMEDVKQELITLYMGSELSTMSAKDSVGASLQGESTADRQRADCVRIGETLTATPVPLVIKWYFGDEARVLVRVTLEPPDNEDANKLLERVQGAVSLGAQVPIEPVCKRIGVPLAKKGEEVFKASAPRPAVQLPEETKTATNADPRPLGKLMATARDLFAEATAKDLQPLRAAIARLLQQHPDDQLAAARALYAALPQLAAQIIPAMANAEALYLLLSTAAAEQLANDRNALSA